MSSSSATHHHPAQLVETPASFALDVAPGTSAATSEGIPEVTSGWSPYEVWRSRVFGAQKLHAES